MARHIALNPALESTKRALRTAAQSIITFAGLVLAIAIPPVQDAANALLDLVGVNYTITPALVTAVGAVATLVITIVTKVQNRLEGRDDVMTVEDWANWVEELTEQVNELRARVGDVGDHARWHED